ncbi:MAG: TPM domain-containing protein [Chitinophagales bacterium]|nr:TPM domain-containing protein [Chitinophagales bacterium]MDW8273167.1 TPM domain-containing protein [Chitinophagales bacterium]
MNFQGRKIISDDDVKRIQEAISQAEKRTSGEIRVHLEKKCVDKHGALSRAKKLFNQLEMYKTENRNGVIIYVALEDHVFAIIGDKGIHEKVSADFWDCTKDLMAEYFKQGRIIEGIIAGIERTGEKLKQYFPAETNDKNELDDTVSFS